MYHRKYRERKDHADEKVSQKSWGLSEALRIWIGNEWTFMDKDAEAGKKVPMEHG